MYLDQQYWCNQIMRGMLECMSHTDNKGTGTSFYLASYPVLNSDDVRIIRPLKMQKPRLRNLYYEALVEAGINETLEMRRVLHVYYQSHEMARERYNQALGTTPGGRIHPDLNYQKAGSGLRSVSRVNICNLGGTIAALDAIAISKSYAKGFPHPFNTKLDLTADKATAASNLKSNISALSARVGEEHSDFRKALGGFLDDNISAADSMTLHGTLVNHWGWLPLKCVTDIVLPLWCFTTAILNDTMTVVGFNSVATLLKQVFEGMVAAGVLVVDAERMIYREMITTFHLAFEDIGILQYCFPNTHAQPGWITDNFRARCIGQMFPDLTPTSLLPISANEAALAECKFFISRNMKEEKSRIDTDFNVMTESVFPCGRTIDYHKTIGWEVRTKSSISYRDALELAQLGGNHATYTEPAGTFLDYRGNDADTQPVLHGVGYISYGVRSQSLKQQSFSDRKAEAGQRTKLSERARTLEINDADVPNRAQNPVPIKRKRRE